MDMKKYVIKLNGKTYEVEMGEVGSVPMSPASAGLSHSSTPSTPSTPSTLATNPNVTNGEVVLAPMPGNIINVLVNVGDVVKRNQVVLVLEAMKMENEIVAPMDGKIIALAAVKGTSVNVSEQLFTIG